MASLLRGWLNNSEPVSPLDVGIEPGILVLLSIGSSLPHPLPHAGISTPCLGYKVTRTLLSLYTSLLGDRFPLYLRVLWAQDPPASASGGDTGVTGCVTVICKTVSHINSVHRWGCWFVEFLQCISCEGWKTTCWGQFCFFNWVLGILMRLSSLAAAPFLLDHLISPKHYIFCVIEFHHRGPVPTEFDRIHGSPGVLNWRTCLQSVLEDLWEF